MRILLLAIFLTLVINSLAQDQSGNYYKLTIDSTLRKISVDARLNLTGDHLLMNWEAANFLPKGWSTFISGVSVSTLDGVEIDVEYEIPGKWSLSKITQVLNLKYTVNIGHDMITWEEGGHDEAAYVLDQLLFMIGRVVFITAGKKPEFTDTTSYVVEFGELPQDYRVLTVWKPLDREARKWLVNGTKELLGSTIMVGKMDQITVEKGGASITLASAPNYKTAIEMFADVFDPLLSSTQKVFGNTETPNFVLNANLAPITREAYFSGGVLERSISIISPFVPDETVLPLIQHMLYHEYLHVFTLEMNIDNNEAKYNYWFTEGVHDYVSLLFLKGSGKIGEDEFLNHPNGLLGNWSNYKPVAHSVNIRNAGEQKFDNYDLIYSGGHVLGAVMDIAFLINSKGKYDLLSYYSEILELAKRQKKKNVYLSFEEIKALAVKSGGNEIEEIFNKFILGNELIPLNEYLQKIGINLNEDIDQIQLMETKSLEGNISKLRKLYLDREAIQSNSK